MRSQFKILLDDFFSEVPLRFSKLVLHSFDSCFLNITHLFFKVKLVHNRVNHWQFRQVRFPKEIRRMFYTNHLIDGNFVLDVWVQEWQVKELQIFCQEDLCHFLEVGLDIINPVELQQHVCGTCEKSAENFLPSSVVSKESNCEHLVKSDHVQWFLFYNFVFQRTFIKWSDFIRNLLVPTVYKRRIWWLFQVERFLLEYELTPRDLESFLRWE